MFNSVIFMVLSHIVHELVLYWFMFMSHIILWSCLMPLHSLILWSYPMPPIFLSLIALCTYPILLYSFIP